MIKINTKKLFCRKNDIEFFKMDTIYVYTAGNANFFTIKFLEFYVKNLPQLQLLLCDLMLFSVFICILSSKLCLDFIESEEFFFPFVLQQTNAIRIAQMMGQTICGPICIYSAKEYNFPMWRVNKAKPYQNFRNPTEASTTTTTTTRKIPAPIIEAFESIHIYQQRLYSPFLFR